MNFPDTLSIICETRYKHGMSDKNTHQKRNISLPASIMTGD